MKIFSHLQTSSRPLKEHHSSKKSDNQAKASKQKTRSNKSPRMNLSASEIREKVRSASHKSSNANQSKKVGQSLEENMSGEESLQDVSVNNPQDPVTQEKLKKVLSTNAFSFSEREKQVLQGILGE